jgi:diguanylate cyclase (GGDEF)-like protein
MNSPADEIPARHLKAGVGPAEGSTVKWWHWTTGLAIALALSSRAFTADLPATIILETGSAIAVFGAVVAARIRSDTNGWSWLAAGLVCWWVGDIVFDYFRLREGEVPSLSLGDPLYLIGYPLMAVGCVRLIRQDRQPGQRDGLLDGIAFSGAAALAAWRFLAEPSFADSGSTLERFVLAAYPLGDVLLLALVSWLALAPGRHRRPSRILGGFLTAILAIDVAYAIGTHTEATTMLLWMDAAYPVAYTLLAIAIVQQPTAAIAKTEHGLHLARVLFLGIALWLIPVLTVSSFGVRIDRSVVAMIASAATTAAVLARFVFVVRERDRARQDLIHVASHDPLTGLANRRLFMERLDRASTAPGHTAALIFIDLDGLKGVNDRHGHDIGDLVLIEVGRRMRACAPDGALSARLGGDEFAILCDNLTNGLSAQVLADQLLDGMRTDPLALDDGTPLGITASVGVVMFAGGVANAEAFLKHADDLMYAAKRAGGDRQRTSDWRRDELVTKF